MAQQSFEDTIADTLDRFEESINVKGEGSVRETQLEYDLSRLSPLLSLGRGFVFDKQPSSATGTSMTHNSFVRIFDSAKILLEELLNIIEDDKRFSLVVMGQFKGQPLDDPAHVTLVYIEDVRDTEKTDKVFQSLAAFIAFECLGKAPSFVVGDKKGGFGENDAYVIQGDNFEESAIQSLHSCGDPSFEGQMAREHHVTLKHPWSHTLRPGMNIALRNVSIKCPGLPLRKVILEW